MFEEMTGQTYGCMMVDRVELVRYKNGKAKTLCFGLGGVHFIMVLHSFYMVYFPIFLF